MEADIVSIVALAAMAIFFYRVIVPKLRKKGTVKRVAAKKRMRPIVGTKKYGDLEVMGGERITDDKYDFILNLRKTYTGVIMRLPFRDSDIVPVDIFQILVGASTDRQKFEMIAPETIDYVDEEIEKLELKDQHEKIVVEATEEKAKTEGLYVCPVCDKVCASRIGLIGHSRTHKKDEESG